MPHTRSLEYHCNKINRMEVSSRIRAIELILHSLDRPTSEDKSPRRHRLFQRPVAEPVAVDDSVPQKRGRLSELEGIGKGTWEGIDIDQFIREERDSWDS